MLTEEEKQEELDKIIRSLRWVVFNRDEMDLYTQQELTRIAYERMVLDMTDEAGGLRYQLHMSSKLYTDLGRRVIESLVKNFVRDNVREEHFRNIWPVAYATEEPGPGEDEMFSASCRYKNPQSPNHGRKLLLIFFKDFDGMNVVQAMWEGEAYYINPF
jgi:hypothetical protein